MISGRYHDTMSALVICKIVLCSNKKAKEAIAYRIRPSILSQPELISHICLSRQRQSPCDYGVLDRLFLSDRQLFKGPLRAPVNFALKLTPHALQTENHVRGQRIHVVMVLF